MKVKIILSVLSLSALASAEVAQVVSLKAGMFVLILICMYLQTRPMKTRSRLYNTILTICCCTVFCTGAYVFGHAIAPTSVAVIILLEFAAIGIGGALFCQGLLKNY